VACPAIFDHGFHRQPVASENVRTVSGTVFGAAIFLLSGHIGLEGESHIRKLDKNPVLFFDS